MFLLRQARKHYGVNFFKEFHSFFIKLLFTITDWALYSTNLKRLQHNVALCIAGLDHTIYYISTKRAHSLSIVTGMLFIVILKETIYFLTKNCVEGTVVCIIVCIENFVFKALFTSCRRRQNFRPSLLRLVNNCVKSIYKTQKTRFCLLQRLVNSTLVRKWQF